jgi:hypothetical protein
MPRFHRTGVSLNLTIDHDANALLRTVLSPGQKAYGRLISELIRTEVARREERARWQDERERAMVAQD